MPLPRYGYRYFSSSSQNYVTLRSSTESFQLQMGFSFLFLRANNLCSYLFIMRTRSFYSLVRRGYIRKVSVQLVPKYFSHDCSTDIISCSERKNRMRIILKQDSNSRQRQDIVPVSNLKSRKIKTFFSLPIHLSRHIFAAAAVTLFSLLCRSTFAPLSLLLSLLLSLRCRSCCRSAVAPLPRLSLRCCCYHSCCRYAVAPVIAPAVTPLSLLMSICCHSAIAPLSVRCRSVVAPLPLLSLLLLLLCCSCCRSYFCSCCRLNCSCLLPQEAESG